MDKVGRRGGRKKGEDRLVGRKEEGREGLRGGMERKDSGKEGRAEDRGGEERDWKEESGLPSAQEAGKQGATHNQLSI